MNNISSLRKRWNFSSVALMHGWHSILFSNVVSLPENPDIYASSTVGLWPWKYHKRIDFLYKNALAKQSINWGSCTTNLFEDLRRLTASYIDISVNVSTFLSFYRCLITLLGPSSGINCNHKSQPIATAMMSPTKVPDFPSNVGYFDFFMCWIGFSSSSLLLSLYSIIKHQWYGTIQDAAGKTTFDPFSWFW